jgi:hypothetical protein
MSQAKQMSASSPEQPNDPPPQEAPTHDVPVYPEHDPPPERETAMHATKEHEDSPGSDPVEPEDVDEDDLDPRKPHHPPDAGKGKIIFDENGVAS